MRCNARLARALWADNRSRFADAGLWQPERRRSCSALATVQSVGRLRCGFRLGLPTSSATWICGCGRAAHSDTSACAAAEPAARKRCQSRF